MNRGMVVCSSRIKDDNGRLALGKDETKDLEGLF